MVRCVGICLAVAGLMSFGSVGSAEEFEKMGPEITELYAKYLSENFDEKVPGRQLKFAVEPAKAIGLHRNGQEGVMAVPAKGLKEDPNDPAFESEKGAPLCYLFLTHTYAPIVDGKPIDPTRLNRFKINDEAGAERDAACMILTVKHVAGDEWRLLGFGSDAKPIVSSVFGQASKDGVKSVEMRVDAANDGKAKLEMTVHKKYSAEFSFMMK